MIIYKFQFEVEGEVTIPMPKGAHILAVQVQHNSPCLWAIVDPEQPIESRTFRIFGTGHEMDVDMPHCHYIGTFQLLGGSFIGHLFEARATKGGDR